MAKIKDEVIETYLTKIKDLENAFKVNFQVLGDKNQAILESHSKLLNDIVNNLGTSTTNIQTDASETNIGVKSNLEGIPRKQVTQSTNEGFEHISNQISLIQTQIKDLTIDYPQEITSLFGETNSKISSLLEALSIMEGNDKQKILSPQKFDSSGSVFLEIEKDLVSFKKDFQMVKDQITESLEKNQIQTRKNDEKLLQIEKQQQLLIHSVTENADKLVLGFSSQLESFEQDLQEGIAKYIASILPSITSDLVGKFETLIAEMSRLREQSITGDQLEKIFANLKGFFGHKIDLPDPSADVSSGSRTGINLPSQFNQDIDEINSLIRFFRRSPSKRESIVEAERVRDIILTSRPTEAPYRFMVSKLFREIIDDLKRENQVIERPTNRAVIHKMEKLTEHIITTT